MTDTPGRTKSLLEDVHDRRFEVRVVRQMKEDVTRFSKRDFSHRDCPACGSDQRTLNCTADGFQFQECSACKTLYLSPCPNDEEIVDFLNSSEGFRMWREDMPQDVIDRRQRMYRERAELIISLLSASSATPATVLEIGAGNGYLAQHLIDNSIDYIGIEPQPLPKPIAGAEIIIGTFQNAQMQRPVDVVCAFEVIEHLTDPHSFLNFARGALKPLGSLVITTPNCAGYEIQKLGARSHSVAFDHVAVYNPISMRGMLNRAGFTDIKITTPGRFDAELVLQAWREGLITLDTNEATELQAADFQDRLQHESRSAHMRVVAKAPV